MEDRHMSVNIYYFSGTGNSLYIAKKVAEKTKGNLKPIASIIKQKEIKDDSDVVGIIFPLYYGELPNIMRRFATKLKNIESKYIFVVCTYGGGGAAIKNINSIIKSQGGIISAGYGIHMPQNAFFKASENYDKLYKKASLMIEIICKNIEQKKKGMFSSNIIVDILSKPLYFFLKPLYIKHLMKISNTLSKKSREELIYLAGNSFKTNKKCSSCGICAKVCPVNNIDIINNKPVWHNRCENCLACYNHCPQHAIETEIVEKDYYYKHPEIGLKDMINQKKGIK
jgi:Pyruvate/2-oxoacid:ferredoxin oxidoreductase delta subunit/flavodoxin